MTLITYKKIYILLCSTLMLGFLQAEDTGTCRTACSWDSCNTSGSASSSVNFFSGRNSSCCNACHSEYIPRSADSNTAYKYLPGAHTATDEKFNAYFSLGYEYQQSFDGKQIAQCLFGSPSLLFQGSQVINREDTAIIAENFGLSPQWSSLLSFNPRIKNQNLHFQSFFGFDNYCSGLYAQLNATFSSQQRQLQSHEQGTCPLDVSVTATIALPAGFVAKGTTEPAPNIISALSGDFLFGEMTTPWNFGRFNFCEQTVNKLAGLDVMIGYDFWRYDTYHMGLYALYVAPTGNRGNPRTIFSPISGNGHYHELGGGFTAHAELWNDDEERSFAAYFDGQITTLLSSHQIRSFDFKDKGCLSRYLLLKELTPTTDATAFSYTGNLINGINYATRNVRSKFDVRGDATLRFIFHTHCWDIGFGYNLYGHTKEHLCLSTGAPCNTDDLSKRHFGFKGSEGSYNNRYTTSAGVITAAPITSLPSNATGSVETITTYNVEADNQTPVIDSATEFTVTWRSNNNNQDITPGTTTATLTTAGTYEQGVTSLPAVEITTNDLNVGSGKAPSQLSNKGFVTLCYTLTENDYKPYIQAIIQVEGNTRCCDLKQFGIGIMGGISF